MPGPFYFISYSRVDGEDFALELGDQLVAGPPSIDVWLDRRRLQAGIDWDEQLADALGACVGFIYVMTRDSVSPTSECKKEWTRALKYKKPIIPLLVHRNVELPYRLEPRQYIDFSHGFDAGLAGLRLHLRWRGTPAGALHALKERLNDARRDLVRANTAEKARVEDEIAELERQIVEQQQAIDDPEAARQRTEKSIQAGLERERQPPEETVSAEVLTPIINRPPMIPPVYFQDRLVETGLIGTFLKDESIRLITVIGRGGIGKTAMVCRLMRSLEGGKLPDNGGVLAVDGIVYLSGRAGHPVNFPNLFADLCKLLPETCAKRLNQLYRDANQSAAAQMQALLAAYPSGRTIVFLDNFEDVVDAETQAIKEQDLDDALRMVLKAPPHGLTFILTTRVAPRLLLTQPGVQQTLPLEKGLPSPFAEEVLKAMDADGTLGLRDPEAPLDAAREATGGYPKALEAIVGILRTDRSTTLRDVLAELEQLQPQAAYVVWELVDEAFNQLDPTAQEVLQALAIYGAAVPQVAITFLLQPYRFGVERGPLLKRLVNMRFVRSEAGRYYLHQLDRDYALSRIPEGKPEDRAAEPPPFTRYALRHRAAEYFKNIQRPLGSAKTLDDLAPQLVEFDLRYAGSDWDTAAAVLSEMESHLIWCGHVRLVQNARIRLTDRISDQRLQMLHYKAMGEVSILLGPLEDAIYNLHCSLRLSRDLEDRQTEGLILFNLSDTYRRMGRLVEAESVMHTALGVANETGNCDQHELCIMGLGLTLAYSGRPHDSIGYAEQLIALIRSDESAALSWQRAYNVFALAYLVMGEAEQAAIYAQKAREENARARAAAGDVEDVSTYLHNISGMAYLRLGRNEEAELEFIQAVSGAQEIEQARPEGFALFNLARLYHRRGEIEHALTYAEASAQKIGKLDLPAASAVSALIDGLNASLRKDRRSEAEALLRCADSAKDLPDIWNPLPLVLHAEALAHDNGWLDLVETSQELGQRLRARSVRC